MVDTQCIMQRSIKCGVPTLDSKDDYQIRLLQNETYARLVSSQSDKEPT